MDAYFRIGPEVGVHSAVGTAQQEHQALRERTRVPPESRAAPLRNFSARREEVSALTTPVTPPVTPTVGAESRGPATPEKDL